MVAAAVGVVWFGASIDLSNVFIRPIKYFLALWGVVSFIANVVVLLLAVRNRWSTRSSFSEFYAELRRRQTE
jgi:hypothetical protein